MANVVALSTFEKMQMKQFQIKCKHTKEITNKKIKQQTMKAFQNTNKNSQTSQTKFEKKTEYGLAK